MAGCAVQSADWLAATAGDLPGGAVVSIRSSLQLAATDVAALEELVGSRNRFVCLQLVTMVREQLARNAAAAAAGDAEALQQGESVFLASISAAGRLVGGALFYPRLAKPAKKLALPQQPSTQTISLAVRAGPVGVDGAIHVPQPAAAAAAEPGSTLCAGDKEAAQQKRQAWAPQEQQSDPTEAGVATSCSGAHVYVELLCVNAPGQGHGSRLLSAIERWVAANAARLQQQQPQLGAITGVRLLSVGGAQQFYEKLGYGPPDEHHEMFKPLPVLA